MCVRIQKKKREKNTSSTTKNTNITNAGIHNSFAAIQMSKIICIKVNNSINIFIWVCVYVYVEKKIQLSLKKKWRKINTTSIVTIRIECGKIILKRKSFTFWHVFTLICSLARSRSLRFIFSNKEIPKRRCTKTHPV